jgi:hypothetical protein
MPPYTTECVRRGTARDPRKSVTVSDGSDEIKELSGSSVARAIVRHANLELELEENCLVRTTLVAKEISITSEMRAALPLSIRRLLPRFC